MAAPKEAVRVTRTAKGETTITVVVVNGEYVVRWSLKTYGRNLLESRTQCVNEAHHAMAVLMGVAQWPSVSARQ